MAIAFDGSTKIITLDSASVTAAEIWSRWIDWFLTSDNSKYLPAFVNVGGDDIDVGAGTKIPIYAFLMNGWKVRPMEQDHLLVINGNLFVDGGGAPVVNTLGDFNVSIQYTVPVQAQAFSTSGGSSFTLEQIADAVRSKVVGDIHAAKFM